MTGSHKRMIGSATAAKDLSVETHSRFGAESDSMIAVEIADFEIEVPVLEVCTGLIALTRVGPASDIYTLQDEPSRYYVTVHVSGIAASVTPTATLHVPSP